MSTTLQFCKDMQELCESRPGGIAMKTYYHFTGTKLRDDPRGPMRTITAVGEYRKSIDGSGGCIPVTFDCGHIAELNFTFSYRVGDTLHCFACGPHAPKHHKEMRCSRNRGK